MSLGAGLVMDARGLEFDFDGLEVALVFDAIGRVFFAVAVRRDGIFKLSPRGIVKVNDAIIGVFKEF